MVKKALIAFLCVLSLATGSSSEQIAVTSFKGLDTNSNPVIIGPEFASDALNVDISPGGKSVKKRPGYGLYKTLSGTQGVHGGYHLFDSVGNDVTVWGSSTSLWGIVGDATPTQLISSATLNATWDCEDIQGSAYCVNSSRDALIRTNGATMTWLSSALGTLVASTPDRLVVGGVAGSLSTLYISGSNDFTNFTVGALPTSPFTEQIAAPGSKLTHARWACGKLLWWKDQSFGWFAFEDQFTAQVKIVSDTIGTIDNTSAIDPGGSVWFRGQDGHIWQYDCSGLIKQSIEITPQIQGSGRRTANAWEQTSLSDWNAGAVIPVLQLSTAIASGDITVSSFTVTENSAASGWSSGSTNNTTVGTSSISLTTNNSGNITDNSFEIGVPDNFGSNWADAGTANGWLTKGSQSPSCTVTPQSGSVLARTGDLASGNASVKILLASDNSTLATTTITGCANTCTWTQYTLTSSGNVGKRIKIQLNNPTSASTETTLDSYILGGDITFYGICNNAGGVNIAFVDNIQSGSSTITTGSFTSQVFNTGLTSATYSLSNFAWTVNTSTPTFALLTSTASPSNNWVSLLTSSSTNAVGNKYARYVATITITNVDSALTSITAATILARSSGTFYSAWKNAPSFVAWSTFNPIKSDGDGSHVFYVRSSTSPQSVLNSTVAWVAQPADALVATSTPGIYFQIRDDFTIGAATNTPTLNSFSVNWFEGMATDQAYMLYFDNSIWTSVAYGVGVSSNTYIFRRDLINDGWLLYNFGAGGMLVQNNHLFFGAVGLTGKLYQFDSGHSDEGAVINSYWRTKEFTGADPFLQSSLVQIDTFSKKDQGSTLTVTYTMDTSTTTTSYSIGLSSTTQSVIQSRKQLPAGKTGYNFNIKYGDSSASSDWEIFLFRIGFTQNVYRPSQ